MNYTAPEYLQGYAGSNISDIYSLGVVTYEMLTGELPYGKKELTLRKLRRARYHSAAHLNAEIPVWIDRALEKATAIERKRRYSLLSEFTHDLAHPNPVFASRTSEPLMDRNPLLVWKGIATLLFVLNLFFLYLLAA